MTATTTNTTLFIEDGVHQALVLDAAKGLRHNVSHLRLRVHQVEDDLLRVDAQKNADETGTRLLSALMPDSVSTWRTCGKERRDRTVDARLHLE